MGKKSILKFLDIVTEEPEYVDYHHNIVHEVVKSAINADFEGVKISSGPTGTLECSCENGG